nr:MAG TPA: hypothetical protein [Caudoviricetes sp.]
MGRIRNIMPWLMAVIMLVGCAASRKTEGSKSEERRDSTVVVITDSVKKTDVKTDSTVTFATDESHTSGTTSEKGRGEEIIQERVTESTDAQGNKTTTTDRTIHRKGDYERNSSYKEHFKHLESTISRMQHTIDSLVLSNKLNVGTHWAKNDSTGVEKEKNTKDIKVASDGEYIRMLIAVIICFALLFWYVKHNEQK